MAWQLSNAHLSAEFVHPRNMTTRREELCADYRRFLVRSHLTADLHERASLQAAAAHIRQVLRAAAGFGGTAIVLLAEGDDQVTYNDGNSAPLHCTVCFLGPAADLTPIERERVIVVTKRLGEDFAPFEARVVSPAEFGDETVSLVEHPALNDIRDAALADHTVNWLREQNDEHPNYLPHVSGLDGQESVRFDRIAAMIGGDTSNTYPLAGTQTPDADEDHSSREFDRDSAR
jgi:hypothetical protein